MCKYFLWFCIHIHATDLCVFLVCFVVVVVVVVVVCVLFCFGGGGALFWFSLWIWAAQSAAMLVHTLQMKSTNMAAYEYSFLPYRPTLFMTLQTQHGSAHSHVFMTFKCQFLTNWTIKWLNNCQSILYSTLIDRASGASLPGIPFNLWSQTRP